MKAPDFCTKAAELMTDRGKERDQANGERSMARCVAAFNSMTGHKLSIEDGWLFMVYLKHARMRGGQFKQDDYEDAVAYEALMAEEALLAHARLSTRELIERYITEGSTYKVPEAFGPITLSESEHAYKKSLEDAYDECHPEGCHACNNLNCPRR